MSILQAAKASMNPTTFSKEFLEQQFAKMSGQELCNAMKIGGEDLDGDYTKDEMIQIILWGNRPSSKIRGAFHAWIYDKKTKKIIDDYTDPSTYVGKLFSHLQKIHNLPDVRYEEFEKNPKFVETLLTETNTDWKHDWFQKYMNSENWDRVGYCLQRAFLKHKSSKRRYKIRFGWVYLRNNETGEEINIEGNEDEIHEQKFINKHIQAVQDGYLLHNLYDRKTAAALLQFFARIDNKILEDIINNWDREYLMQCLAGDLGGGDIISQIARDIGGMSKRDRKALATRKFNGGRHNM